MYQLHENSKLTFKKTQQLLITREKSHSRITLLFLQANDNWFQLALDEKVLLIVKLVKNGEFSINNVLADFDLDKFLAIEWSVFNPLVLQFDFDKSLLFSQDNQQIHLALNDDSFVYENLN